MESSQVQAFKSLVTPIDINDAFEGIEACSHQLLLKELGQLL